MSAVEHGFPAAVGLAPSIRFKMPIVYVSRRAHFNAAHRLHNPARSEAWNRTQYGVCNNPNWHGHNYEMEVTVRGTPNEETGYVMDLSVLKQLIEEHVVSKCDHRNLNLDVPFLAGVIPSTENLVVAFWQQLAGPIAEHGAALHCIRLQETPRNSASYYGE